VKGFFMTITNNQVLEHLKHSRLTEECNKLDPRFEQEMAEIDLIDLDEILSVN